MNLRAFYSAVRDGFSPTTRKTKASDGLFLPLPDKVPATTDEPGECVRIPA
jgi:hypothetical protein